MEAVRPTVRRKGGQISLQRGRGDMEKSEKPGTLASFNKTLSNWVGDVFPFH